MSISGRIFERQLCLFLIYIYHLCYLFNFLLTQMKLEIYALHLQMHLIKKREIGLSEGKYIILM
jgi:hypothetical protein